MLDMTGIIYALVCVFSKPNLRASSTFVSPLNPNLGIVAYWVRLQTKQRGADE